MPDLRNVAWSALRGVVGTGIPVNETLVDQESVGSFWVRSGVYISTAQTLVPIRLPRTPSGLIVVDNDTGGVVYRTAADRAASGPSTYACRATSGCSIVGLFF
jgi:hypothetical protein